MQLRGAPGDGNVDWQNAAFERNCGCSGSM